MWASSNACLFVLPYNSHHFLNSRLGSLLILQFNLKLPAEVDEYYAIRAKCEAAGWKPGEVSYRDLFAFACDTLPS